MLSEYSKHFQQHVSHINTNTGSIRSNLGFSILPKVVGSKKPGIEPTTFQLADKLIYVMLIKWNNINRAENMSLLTSTLYLTYLVQCLLLVQILFFDVSGLHSLFSWLLTSWSNLFGFIWMSRNWIKLSSNWLLALNLVSVSCLVRSENQG